MQDRIKQMENSSDSLTYVIKTGWGVVMKKNKARQMACIVRRRGSGNDRALISFSKFEVNSLAFTQHLLPHHVLWCAMQLKQ